MLFLNASLSTAHMKVKTSHIHDFFRSRPMASPSRCALLVSARCPGNLWKNLPSASLIWVSICIRSEHIVCSIPNNVFISFGHIPNGHYDPLCYILVKEKPPRCWLITTRVELVLSFRWCWCRSESLNCQILPDSLEHVAYTLFRFDSLAFSLSERHAQEILWLCFDWFCPFTHQNFML